MTGARTRRWARRILLGVAVLAALAVLASWAFVKFQPTSAAPALPTASASSPAAPAAQAAQAAPVDGTWAVSAGSIAGFRVRETIFGMSNDVVGRTSAVSGALVVSAGRVTSATFRVDLTAITVNGKTQPQFAQSLDTRRFPTATFTLSRPVTLGAALVTGGTVSVLAAGRLSMNGVTRPVSFTVSGRRDGAVLQVIGSIPVTFSGWGIKGPAGFGALGSLADHGKAEFLLTLRQS